MIAAVLRLRDDGVRCGAAGVGLGLAAGIGGILSASIGALVAGVAIAAACAAMLVVQVVLKRAIAPGFTGALPIGLIVALIAAGTQQLALLPWYALPLLPARPACGVRAHAGRRSAARARRDAVRLGRDRRRRFPSRSRGTPRAPRCPDPIVAGDPRDQASRPSRSRRRCP